MDNHLRIGDIDRERTTTALTEHFAAGRLSRDELDHRTDAVLKARTRLDLGEILADLPPLPAPAGDSDLARRKARRLWQTAGLAPWALFSVFFVVLWALTGTGYFWPVWPILGWGIGVAITGVTAYTMPETYLSRQREGRFCGTPSAMR